jgi:orotidine-5'-phosphate decarboxylase
MSIKLIVALDFNDRSQALSLIDQLDPSQCALKIGHEMFTHFGPDFVRLLVSRQFKVFLDLKFHDIPNTVSRACKASADLGVWMINVHASGGLAMMEAASEAVQSYGTSRPLLIAVTVLTSMSTADLQSIGVKESIENRVCFLAGRAQESGLDGVVSSALEVPAIKLQCGKAFLTVTPGIRLKDSLADDQARIITPQAAINAGSDYLVVGRPITQARVPATVVHDILSSIAINTLV